MKKTGKKSLEEAFLKLTGHDIREEIGKTVDKNRAAMKSWGVR
jgi:hypothetical protein